MYRILDIVILYIWLQALFHMNGRPPFLMIQLQLFEIHCEKSSPVEQKDQQDCPSAKHSLTRAFIVRIHNTGTLYHIYNIYSIVLAISVLYLANSVDLDGTAHYKTSHQDLLSLPFCFEF